MVYRVPITEGGKRAPFIASVIDYGMAQTYYPATSVTTGQGSSGKNHAKCHFSNRFRYLVEERSFLFKFYSLILSWKGDDQEIAHYFDEKIKNL